MVSRLQEGDLSYLAAVVDLQGRLWQRPTKSGPLPSVEVNCGNWPLLGWLGKITGTAHFETRRDYQRFGCTEHCAERHVHTTSVSGRWSVSGAKATILLYGVMPYVRLRRPECEALLAVGLSAPMRSQTVMSMQARGWEIPPDALLPTGPRAALNRS